MAQAHYKALLGKVLFGFITEKDSVLAVLEWMAQQIMQVEVEASGWQVKEVYRSYLI